MRRRHDHGHPAGDVLQHRMHHLFALGIGQHELLGEIGQNAEAIGAGVDHEIDTAALPARDRARPRSSKMVGATGKRRDRAVVQSGSFWMFRSSRISDCMFV